MAATTEGCNAAGVKKGHLGIPEAVFMVSTCVRGEHLRSWFYKTSVIVMCFFIPTVVPWYFWGESLANAYFISAILRYALVLNASWLVNSAAHMFGNRPYDKTINPRENAFVAFGAIGEGYHNYHHTFPFDYSASEFGSKYNLTTSFINLMCYVGLATDCKKVPKKVILSRIQRTGDGSYRTG